MACLYLSHRTVEWISLVKMTDWMLAGFVVALWLDLASDLSRLFVVGGFWSRRNNCRRTHFHKKVPIFPLCNYSNRSLLGENSLSIPLVDTSNS